MSKQQNDIAEGVVLVMRGAAVTAESLRAAFRDYLAQSNSAQSTGKTSLGKLAKEAGGKLDNIRISGKNIGEFTDTARKYGVSFALKRDNLTDPPTWYVFFKQDKGSKETMDRAFREYFDKTSAEKIITADGIGDVDIKIQRKKKEPTKEKEREPEQEQDREYDDEPDLPPLDDMGEPEPPDM